MIALLIVDLQNDFLPGGALAVPDGDAIIPLINTLQKRYDLVIASKDWHPPNHSSFASTWPVHCVAHSPGADFPSSLETEHIAKIFHKGTDASQEAYSAFQAEEDLAAYLQKNNVDEIHIVGLALDYCVKATALDGRKAGFKVSILLQACRGLTPPENTSNELDSKGIKICYKAL